MTTPTSGHKPNNPEKVSAEQKISEIESQAKTQRPIENKDTQEAAKKTVQHKEIKLDSPSPKEELPPPPKENDQGTQSEDLVNPYFQGSSMAAVFIALDVIAKLVMELRFEETELALESLQTKFDQSLESAELRKELKQNQAYQSFVGAVTAGIDTVIGTLQIAKTTVTDREAEAQFNSDVENAKKTKDANLEDIKKTFPEVTDKTADEFVKDYDEVHKKEESYKALGDAEKQKLDEAVENYSVNSKSLKDLQSSKINSLNTNRQNIDGIIRMQTDVFRSMTKMGESAINAALQLTAGEKEEQQAATDASVQAISENMQLQQSAAQSARDAIQKFIQSINEIKQQVSSFTKA